MRMGKCVGISLLVALMAALTCVHAGAEEGTQAVTLQDVVVTATRTATPERAVGVSHTVITEEEIQARRAADVPELLRDVAGITLVRYGSQGAQSVVFPRGGENNYTMVMIDGVQVNLGGGDFYWETLSLDNIERIEIIRGPQSALYGSDAIGGVIQIFTKSGYGPPSVELSTAHGARSENGSYLGEQHLRVSGGNERMGFSVAYGRIDDQGALDINNDYWNNSLSARFDLYPKDNWEVTLTGRLNDSRYEYPTESVGDKYSPLDPDQYEREMDTVVGLSTRVQTTSWWENVLSVGYHRNDRKIEDPYNPETDYSSWRGEYDESRTNFDYHANLKASPVDWASSTVTLGYEHERETYEQESTDFTTTTLGADRTNDAFYAQEQLSLFKRVHLVGGARVEDNSAFGTEVSPRGSIAVDIHETGTKLRAAVGKGIKEPTFYENFADDAWTLGNKDLDPEKAVSWEVGVDQRLWSDRLTMSVTYFQSRYKDLIAYVPTPYPAPAVRTPNYFNVQEAESRGVELSLTVKPMENLVLGSSYTFLDTEVTDDGGLANIAFEEGKELIRRPRHSASGWIDWQWRRLRTFVKGRYVGKRDDADYRDWTAPKRVELKDYFVLDATMSYKVPVPAPLKDMELFVKGSNILDEDYEEVFGYTAPGASFMAGLSFRL
ncbi:vitamin B12 transporter [Desulfacinum hydrothermale DSM 13146]|uniref:Vitamin B12 transporter n=1 Tax=Desulfacinum hydrothermale DSM 13146 TaxID=1121390 RepID=A0A1W1XYR5_9BACT|nr:TonB-dependent receptor [Desulfacinum hydrothermale]SMC28648.1 vitamin B12 transporter [Desulfacinum hydrothermale DSM 13146]